MDHFTTPLPTSSYPFNIIPISLNTPISCPLPFPMLLLLQGALCVQAQPSVDRCPPWSIFQIQQILCAKVAECASACACPSISKKLFDRYCYTLGESWHWFLLVLYLFFGGGLLKSSFLFCKILPLPPRKKKHNEMYILTKIRFLLIKKYPFD